MDITLILAAATLGLAGMPHCAAMCSPSCVALWGHTGATDAPDRRQRMIVFLVGRAVGYGLVGGVAAAAVGSVGIWAQVAPWVRPLWALLHALGLALGLWLLVTGRQPAWMAHWGPARPLGNQALAQEAAGVTWHPRRRGHHRTLTTWVGVGRSGMTGMLWATWPCGLLQSAVLVAALGNSATVGALAMVAFAAVSAVPLVVSASLWSRLGRGSWGRFQTLAVRSAGGMLVAGSGFALGQDVWHQVAAYCGF